MALSRILYTYLRESASNIITYRGIGSDAYENCCGSDRLADGWYIGSTDYGAATCDLVLAVGADVACVDTNPYLLICLKSTYNGQTRYLNIQNQDRVYPSDFLEETVLLKDIPLTGFQANGHCKYVDFSGLQFTWQNTIHGVDMYVGHLTTISGQQVVLDTAIDGLDCLSGFSIPVDTAVNLIAVSPLNASLIAQFDSSLIWTNVNGLSGQVDALNQRVTDVEAAVGTNNLQNKFVGR